ncbi:chromatin remodeling protein EBS-like isoform X2 [Andrographis paniculata]|uniref:chromatin remodeling protein EBS-like isoform X2 n=1 Tax=Andrographis paniculata TaxID=175694 RepID=UPI0021E8D379|nr:chromatin remodeling protein EBS-like isoform X2 [Andrographis paniculata]
MAKSKPGKKELASFTMHRTNTVLKRNPPYVAKVEKIESDYRNIVKVLVRWYYRPEESVGGRGVFHGSKELFLSDHYDVQRVETIEGKCYVHTFKNYAKIPTVGRDDYFCRFEYNVATGRFTPDRVAVYCKCEMPVNPDDFMVRCEGCNDWFHPSCVDLTIEEVKKLDHFLCSDCIPEDDDGRLSDSFPV